jgi:signal transduction histidine kinase
VKPQLPGTIAARIGLTSVLSLTALLLVNVGLAYVEGLPDGRDSEWLIPARIVDIVQILNSSQKRERATIAAALNTAELGVVVRDVPAVEPDNQGSWKRHKLSQLIQASVDGMYGAPTIVDRWALTEVADPFPRDTPVETSDLLVQVPLAQDQWALLNARYDNSRRSWQRFAIRAAISFLIIGMLSVLAARKLAGPIGDFARAAEQLGMGQEASPLAEKGPRELRVATRAFNQMQERLRRFLEDRMRMLAAISHDLRTPLARLRLRAEFIEDEEQRAKTHADLAAMSDMILATLVFARDDARREHPNLVDLSVLVADICDDIAELGGVALLAESSHVCARCRPIAMARAIGNLIENAVKYGGCARVELVREPNNVVVIVDDDGPGIPVDEQERVFAPFYRLEQSRNPDTGGVGLGLAVSRTIAREHGGDVKLANRMPSGLRARLELPS